MSEQNPYQASNISFDVVESGETPHSSSPRPLSVWVTLILLIAIDILVIFVVTSAFYSEYFRGYVSHESGWELIATRVLHFFTRVLMVAIPTLAIRGIIKRSQTGRWMGILSLLLIFAISVLAHFMQTPSQQNIYANEYEQAGGEMAQILMIFGYLTYVYRFGFARKSKAYFGRGPSDHGERSKYHL